MPWLQPWEAIADQDWSEEFARDRVAKLFQQLAREVGSRHVLRGQTATPVAVRWDTDDTLFQLADGQVAEVHLTWRQEEEPDPRWPSAHVFASLEDWRRERLAAQHAEWLAVNGGDGTGPD